MPRPRRWNTETETWEPVLSLQPYAEQGFYQHVQTHPSTTWEVIHNLRRHPAVHVEDTSGNVVYGSIQFLDNDRVTITFSTPVTGIVYCN